jgi:hypothetical protein
VFSNYSLRQTISYYRQSTFYQYQDSCGFGQTVGANTYYFITDYVTGDLIKYNENWVYQSYVSLGAYSISFLENIGSYLYVTFDTQLLKLDDNMNTLSTYSLSATYRGIVYAKNVLYVASYTLNRVDVFDGIVKLIYCFN